jgi:hypothetical protein
MKNTFLACASPVVHTQYESHALTDSKTGELIVFSHTDNGINHYETATSMQSIPELDNNASDFCHWCGAANQYGEEDNLRQHFDCYYCGSN